MLDFNIPACKKKRVIINTDAKNEVDDQFAVVHGLLTQGFDLRGLIAAHFGRKKSLTSMQDSFDEIQLLLKLMDMEGQVNVVPGALDALPDMTTPEDSEGVQLIIREAMKDEGTLYVAFLGPLTDMASALLLRPEIAKRDIKVIWIGGGEYPEGRQEYNLSNDIHGANVVFQSGIEVWQVPRNVYRQMPVSFAEMRERVYPCGELGRYLTDNVITYNNEHTNGPLEHRALGDSPAIGIMMYSDCGTWTMKERPIFNADMTHTFGGGFGTLRVYETIDSRFIMEDFYAKLHQWNCKSALD